MKYGTGILFALLGTMVTFRSFLICSLLCLGFAPLSEARQAVKRTKAIKVLAKKGHSSLSSRNSSLTSRTRYRPPAQDLPELTQKDSMFYGHGTDSARALKLLQWSYSRIAGQDTIEGSFLTNSLNLGVWENIQVGTSPLLWFVPNSANASAKLTLFDNESFAFALSYFHLTSNSSILGTPFRLHMNGLALINNWNINPWWMAAYQIQINHTYGYLEAYDYDTEATTPVSHYADLQYQISDQWFVTSGLSYSIGPADSIVSVSDLSRQQIGFGASTTWRIPKNWLSFYPSIGMHFYPEANKSTFLASIFFH